MAGRSAQQALLAVPGQTAQLFVRPHQLSFVPPGVTPLNGVVSLVRRHGAIRRAEVSVEGLSRRIDVDVPVSMVLSRGDRVGLRITQGYLFHDQ
jgi:sulfate transport system ATP-binding protein